MTTLQKDLLCDLKKELCSNIALLVKVKPISTELSVHILKNHGVEKLTQPVFNELSYYLISIVDSHASASLPWPLYSSKCDKLYRDGICNFVNSYNDVGMLTPVMSAYLVNPGCFKAIKLLYQLSTLALQRLLFKKLANERKKTLYESVTKKYNSNETDGFFEDINEETGQILCKFTKYIYKHKAMVHIAEIMCKQIIKMNETLSKCDAQNYINVLIDGFIEMHPLDETRRIEVERMKNVSKPSEIFDTWHNNIDIELDEMEQKWHEKMEPFIKLCQTTQQCTQDLISRHVGETDKSMHTIEYNPKTDEISTKDLQSHVNMEQKYVLKNIAKDGRLSFPFLIRGFLVAICYVLKDAEIDEEIHEFNKYLSTGKTYYIELASSMRTLIERVADDELKLQPSTLLTLSESLRPKHNLSIPPIPNLTDLRSNRNIHNQIIFDAFTPLNISKHQFNLFRKKNISFTRPQPMLATPFHHFLKEDTSKSIISCRMSSYNRQHISQNFHNMSIVPLSNRMNETVTERGTGFTKHQIKRLLSTVKKRSTKKASFKAERPKINFKIGLFNETTPFNENRGLIRSYSSPNLLENREKRSIPKLEARRLSIMQENLEVSGIVALETENSYGTPQFLGNSACANAKSLPHIKVTPEPEKDLSDSSSSIGHRLNNDTVIAELNLNRDEATKTETPKNNMRLISKTNSLEKIINRFRRVKANVLSVDNIECSGCNEGHSKISKVIIEEKENLKTVDLFHANGNSLRDSSGSSFSKLSQESMDYLDTIYYNVEEKVRNKPRESLGTALGVDHTFLDQFDLID